MPPYNGIVLQKAQRFCRPGTREGLEVPGHRHADRADRDGARFSYELQQQSELPFHG